MKPSLKEIRDHAISTPDRHLIIGWDEIEQPGRRAEFEDIMPKAFAALPLMEQVYSTLILRGESIARPGEPTSLSYEEIEAVEERLIDELTLGYQFQDVWERYLAIRDL